MWVTSDDVWFGTVALWVESLPFNVRVSSCICPTDGLRYWFSAGSLFVLLKEASDQTISILKWLRSFAQFLSVSSSVSNYSPFLQLFSLHFVVLIWARNAVCCIEFHCPALCGVAPFSVRQPPNLTSYFQKEEWTSCFKLVFSVALVCAVEHAACSGFTQRDINSSRRSRARVIKSKKTNAFSDLSALCFVCVLACHSDFLCISVCFKTFTSSPIWAVLEGTVWGKKVCAFIYFGVSFPCKWEQLWGAWFPWIPWTFMMDAAGSPGIL